MVEPPPLLQFVLLSMLLHVLVIVLIGNQSGVGARRGEGWLGPLDVTLRRLAAEPRAPLGLAPSAERGAAVRQRSEAPPETARARPSEKPEPALIEPPRLEMQAPQEAERELFTPSPIEQIAPPRLEPEIVPPVSLPPREAPEVPGMRIERIGPGRREPDIAPPVELRARERPVVPRTPIEKLAPVQPERPMAPPVALPPREVPQLPSAPVEGLAPTPSEREIAPPVELPAREAPQLPSAPMERIAPRAIERELEPGAPAILRPAPAAPASESGPAPATRPAPGAGVSASPAQAPARQEAAPAEELPRLRFGAPQPDEDMFKPRREVVTPPSKPGELPHIDREAARQRAREIASGGGSRGVINLPLPVPPEKKSKEARALEKAARPDCRTEYADLGLLAVPALLANAITDSGCKW